MCYRAGIARARSPRRFLVPRSAEIRMRRLPLGMTEIRHGFSFRLLSVFEPFCVAHEICRATSHTSIGAPNRMSTSQALYQPPKALPVVVRAELTRGDQRRLV